MSSIGMRWSINDVHLIPIELIREGHLINKAKALHPFGIAGFHTVRVWVQSVYYGINNTRPIYSGRAHRALQNP